MAMPSPELLANQRDAKAQAMGREGSAPPLSPPGRGRRKVKLIGAALLVLAVLQVYSWYKRKEMEPKSQQQQAVPRPTEKKSSGLMSAFDGGSADKDPFKDVKIRWVSGDLMGVSLEGSDYEISPGDDVGEFTFGLSGVRWFDVRRGKESRRIAVPVPPLERSTGVGGVGSAGSPAPQSGSVGAPPPGTGRTVGGFQNDRGHKP